MQSDFRDHPLFKQAEERARAWLRPGTGEVASLDQIMVSPDGRCAAAAATVCEVLEGLPSTRIALVDLATGELEIMTHGPHSDSAPKWAPDGRTIAFLSDREQEHVHRLRLLDLDLRTDRAAVDVDGFVENLEWSSDGNYILLSVADYGSELAGVQGAFAVELDEAAQARVNWAPSVEGSREAVPWRSLWLYDVVADSVRRVTAPGINIWQAAWCGVDRVAAICSDEPEETWWYSADLRLIDLATGRAEPLFRPLDQLGWLTVAPSGQTIAVVEAVCSDRNIVAGELRLIDVVGGAVLQPDTLGADVVQLHWRGDDALLFVAAQGPETVIGLVDCTQGASRELWRAKERSPSGEVFPQIAPLGRDPASVLFLCESYFDPPALIALDQGCEREVCRFGAPATEEALARLGVSRDFSWTAPDGLEIQGWLLTPPGPGPFPVVLQVHGGPVWYYRPAYVGRSLLAQMALAAGYAVFQPNVRGSSGRGVAFARRVFGDMGGADTQDYLSGLDALEKAGIADGRRIGVTGISYGGFISAWLITQDQRFAAAVPVSPVTNWVSEHLTCNIPRFCEVFLEDELSNPTGRYFTRSPIHFASQARTPTLNVCGALDRITPAGQSIEFHRALRQAGVESVIVTYPREGHGVSSMPALFDHSARMMDWFARTMSPGQADRSLCAGQGEGAASRSKPHLITSSDR